MTPSKLVRRAACVTLAAAATALPITISAQVPTPSELSRVSPAGNYLAAREAGAERDSGAAAAYYRAALKSDPKNPELLERAFLSVLSDGEIDDAVKLADRIVQVDHGHRIARLVLGVRAIKQKQYPAARQHLDHRRIDYERHPIAAVFAR